MLVPSTYTCLVCDASLIGLLAFMLKADCSPCCKVAVIRLCQHDTFCVPVSAQHQLAES